MTPFDFYNTVQLVQKEYDLSRLTLGGVNHWMIVRLLMLSNLASMAARATQALVGTKSHSRMIDNPMAALSRSSMKLAYYKKQVIERSAILFEPPESAGSTDQMVFYELPVDYTQVIDGCAVNRIADGFVEAFGNVRKVCRFDFELARSDCRINPSYVLFAPAHLTAAIAERERFLTATRELCLFLDRNAPNFSVSPSLVLKSVAQVLAHADAHEAWLKVAKPRTVAFQCFVSLEKMGLLIACKRLGIRVLEVQHGYCDAFSIFNEMPSFGPNVISIMPDVFWTWGPMTREALASDPGFHANEVQVVMGGDVWGTLASRRARNDVEGFLHRVAAPQHSRKILLGHQIESLLAGGETDSVVPRILVDAIRGGSPTWLWMIRVHPRSSHLIEPISEALKNLGITNCELIHSTISPIEVVLEAADCYVTGFSVSAFEANKIGKPVIIYDEIGRRLFAPLIEAGMFCSAESGAELVQRITDLRPPSGDTGYYSRDLDLARSAFEAVMAGVSQPRTAAEATAPIKLAVDELDDVAMAPAVPDPALIQSAAEQAP